MTGTSLSKSAVPVAHSEYARLLRIEAALERVAVGRRADGTYNLSREACEQIAREALDRG